MAMIIKDNEEFDLTPEFKSDKGNPAKVDGIPEWSVSDPAFLTVVPAADGLSAVVKAVGPVGTGQVGVTGDADLSTGVRQIIGRLDVEVVAGEATVVNMNPGAARPQATPTPAPVQP